MPKSCLNLKILAITLPYQWPWVPETCRAGNPRRRVGSCCGEGARDDRREGDGKGLLSPPPPEGWFKGVLCLMYLSGVLVRYVKDSLGVGTTHSVCGGTTRYFSL